MKVLKFGGSSVANSENIKKVLAIVANASKEQKVAVVVSAFGKTTDNLLAAANSALVDITIAKNISNHFCGLYFYEYYYPRFFCYHYPLGVLYIHINLGYQ